MPGFRAEILSQSMARHSTGLEWNINVYALKKVARRLKEKTLQVVDLQGFANAEPFTAMQD